MPKYTNVGDAIECEKAHIITRKFIKKGPEKDPILNKICYKFSCDRNSSATITEELELTDDEKAKRPCNIHFQLDDELDCDAMVVYVEGLKCPKCEIKEGVSHRHGANICDTKKRTYAKITIPFQNALKRLGYTSKPLLDNKNS